MTQAIEQLETNTDELAAELATVIEENLLEGLPIDLTEQTTAFLKDLTGTLHSGATHALTHFFQGKERSALDGYVRTANDILFNPDGTLEQVKQTFERQAEAETDEGGQTGLASQAALAQIERVRDDVRVKAEQFEERDEELRERFEAPMQ